MKLGKPVKDRVRDRVEDRVWFRVLEAVQRRRKELT